MPVRRNHADQDMRALQHQSKAGNLTEMRYLLEVRRVPVDAFDKNSLTHAHTPAQMAAASGNGVEALKLLYEFNADFFVLSRTGMTLEAIAWKHKDFESYAFILEVKGALRT
ncbi:MAG: hypothetical protein KGH71_02030 [Candidatus Micrarchaeota archaeon]|nr:hypothetical protein [Candidatus Micrarchaeota archaeon]